ncbi:MAG: hypothetical protein ACRC4T_15580 [Cetobacterium sp.]
MNNTVLFTLSKTFEKKEYMISFLKGNLRFVKLSYYRKRENDCRKDELEGMSGIYQATKSIFKVGDYTIKPEDLAGPIVFYQDEYDYHILCMSAFYFDLNVKIKNEDEFLLHLKKPLLSKMIEFGKYSIVITDTKEFMKRINNELKRLSIPSYKGLVRYLNLEEFHGKLQFPSFMKDLKYQDESEFRIALSPQSEDEFFINIGNIEDIVEIIDTEMINNILCSDILNLKHNLSDFKLFFINKD